VHVNRSADFEGLAEVWLPQSPDHRVAANVSFDPDRGVVIRMLGGPAPPSAPHEVSDRQPTARAATRTISGLEALADHYLAGQPRKIPELFGELGDTPFLVLEAALRLVEGFAAQAPLVEIAADAVLLDFPGDAASASFDRMLITTTWLTELTSLGGLRSQLAWPEGQSGPVRFSAAAEPVDAVHGVIEYTDGRVAVTLRVHHTQAVARRAISLAEEADLELKFPSPVSLARLRETWIPAVEDLVTLAAARRDVAREVWVTRGGSTDIRAAGRAGARLLARRRHQPAPLDEQYIPGVDGRFRIGEIELGSLLTRWMRLLEQDGSAIRLLLAAGDRDGSPVNLRAHVMGLSVAADWWHRRRFDSHHTNPDDHDKRAERLLKVIRASAEIPVDDADWLERKLENSNNKSQLDQMLDIAGSVPDLVCDLTGDPHALGDTGPGRAYWWARWVATARNKGTAHASSRADPFGSYWAAESLRWVLTAAVLTELGIPDAASRFTDDSAYQICREHTRAAVEEKESRAKKEAFSQK